MTKCLFITGAGVSSASGIPTFRGEDGYWTIGSQNYQPEEMATRSTYINHTVEQLKWYYMRFVKYSDCSPNYVHEALKDELVVTQNVDCLDEKAGNKNYIAIHGKITKCVTYGDSEDDLQEAPWDKVDPDDLDNSIIKAFKLSSEGAPIWNHSLKPHILMFDEMYTEVYRYNDALDWLEFDVDKVVFIGTSFSVNFPLTALSMAKKNRMPIDIVDPNPYQWVKDIEEATIYEMTGEEYLKKHYA